MRNPTPVRTVPRTIDDHTLFKTIWIHASIHIITNTNGEEEKGNSRMGKGHWVTDVCYNRNEL